MVVQKDQMACINISRGGSQRCSSKGGHMIYRTRSTRYEPAIHKAHHTGVPLRFPMV
jgi:hypothetical protein